MFNPRPTTATAKALMAMLNGGIGSTKYSQNSCTSSDEPRNTSM